MSGREEKIVFYGTPGVVKHILQTEGEHRRFEEKYSKIQEMVSTETCTTCGRQFSIKNKYDGYYTCNCGKIHCKECIETKLDGEFGNFYCLDCYTNIAEEIEENFGVRI